MARTKLDEDRDVLEAITRKLLDRLRGDMDWLKEHGVGVTVFVAMQEAGLTTDPRGERGRV